MMIIFAWKKCFLPRGGGISLSSKYSRGGCRWISVNLRQVWSTEWVLEWQGHPEKLRLKNQTTTTTTFPLTSPSFPNFHHPVSLIKSSSSYIWLVFLWQHPNWWSPSFYCSTLHSHCAFFLNLTSSLSFLPQKPFSTALLAWEITNLYSGSIKKLFKIQYHFIFQ